MLLLDFFAILASIVATLPVLGMAATSNAALYAEERDQLLTCEEAAEFIGVAPQTLALWRCKSRYGLPYLKIGRRVKYRLVDLRAWLDRQQREGV